jgi:hypothetical protein
MSSPGAPLSGLRPGPCSISPVRLPWRKPEVQESGGTAVADPSEPLPELDQLRAEIETLSEANRNASDPERERSILRARHLAGIRLMDAAPAAPTFPDTARVHVAPGDPLPEFTRDELTPELLRAAILRDGCVLVRGLVSAERALGLVDGIDLAYAARERTENGAVATDGWYEEFTPHERCANVIFRSWIKEGGGLLGADSPRLTYLFTEALADSGFGELVSGYLGEPALFSLGKTTMRKAEPSVSGQWHQDGRFMGPVRSLNLWLSLSRCGDVAPGLDIVPRRLDDYLATGTEGAALDWTISDDQAQQAAGESGVIRPIFEPGDALLFDEVFLHKTGSDPSMPKPRYAIENWFFGGSSFPADYAPIAI